MPLSCSRFCFKSLSTTEKIDKLVQNHHDILCLQNSKILRAKNETDFVIMNKLIQFPCTSVNHRFCVTKFLSSSTDAFQIFLRMSKLYKMLRNIYFNFNNIITANNNKYQRIKSNRNANAKCHNDLNQHAHLSHAECVSVVQSNVTTLSLLLLCESCVESIRFCKTISAPIESSWCTTCTA